MRPPELDVDKFIAIVFLEGVIATLFGLPEAGKTNIASVIMEMLVARGYHVYTIIHFFKSERVKLAIERGKLPGRVRYAPKPEQVHVVEGLSDLLLGLLTTEPNVVVLDEAGIFAKSKLATSKRVAMLEELAYIIRHFSSSMLLIAQSKNSVCPDLRERLVQYEMRIRKMGTKGSSPRMLSIATGVAVLDEFTGEEHIKFEVAEGDEYWGIPLTRYPIDSKYTPHFDILDIDLFEARKRLAKYDSIEVREGHGVNVISQLRDEAGLEEEEGGRTVTVAEMAEKERVTRDTIRRWCNTGKLKFVKTKGGHRRIFVDQHIKKYNLQRGVDYEVAES